MSGYRRKSHGALTKIILPEFSRNPITNLINLRGLVVRLVVGIVDGELAKLESRDPQPGRSVAIRVVGRAEIRLLVDGRAEVRVKIFTTYYEF